MSGIESKVQTPVDVIAVSVFDLKNPIHKEIYEKLLNERKVNDTNKT